MVKFLVKVVIVVLALQTAMNYLRKEEIIVGEIKINYPVVKEKLLKLIPKEKISEKLLDIVNTKIEKRVSSENKPDYKLYSGEKSGNYQKNSFNAIVVHVVTQGETLSELSEIYGVNCKVLKKVNNLSDTMKLEVGQKIKIPTISKNLT